MVFFWGGGYWGLLGSIVFFLNFYLDFPWILTIFHYKNDYLRSESCLTCLTFQKVKHSTFWVLSNGFGSAKISWIQIWIQFCCSFLGINHQFIDANLFLWYASSFRWCIPIGFNFWKCCLDFWRFEIKRDFGIKILVWNTLVPKIGLHQQIDDVYPLHYVHKNRFASTNWWWIPITLCA